MNRLFFILLLPWALFGVEIVCEEVTLADAPLEIRVLDVASDVRIEALLIDEKEKAFISTASFHPENGAVDLSKASPFEGSYAGIDPMGLFWSMKGDGDPSIQGDFFQVSLRAYIEDELMAEKQIKRVILSEDVVVTEVRENGLVGVLYRPKEPSDLPVVITLTGSNGGVSKKRAALLASKGIPSFALGYFRADGLPKQLLEIPLEYFEKAFEWVEHHPALNGQISLYGVSRGGELALLLGAVFPDRFEKIVAAVPSSVVYGSLVDPLRHAWTYRGELVFPPAPIPEIPSHPKGGLRTSDPFSFSAFLLEGSMRKEEWRASRIPVERIQAKTLIFGGGDDQLWPSGFFVQKIAERMNKDLLVWEVFEKAGHGIGIPYLTASILYFDSRAGIWLTMGGTPQENDLACRISWNAITQFLR